MPLVSVIILTKNRAAVLPHALESVGRQGFRDFEIIVVDDGSTDGTGSVIQAFKHLNIQTIRHGESRGIIASRQEALEHAQGEYAAFLDDDDEWIDADKLAKQVKYFEQHGDAAVVGGGMIAEGPTRQLADKNQNLKLRPETDADIRKWMLLKNPFFTSTVMVKKSIAMKAGGFIQDGEDCAEDYDLWLRMGLLGRFYNFPEPFVKYAQPNYNKGRLRAFLRKQLRLIKVRKNDYPHYVIASLMLRARIFMGR